MASYRPVLYHRLLSPSCSRIVRAIRERQLDVELREILLSRRHRQELQRIAGRVQVPCLVLSGMVVAEAEEIEKFLRLRYGT